MSLAEFYMQTTGDNLNSGSTTSDSAVYTSTGGNFDGTSVFTPTDGSTPASSISVGDYVSLYNTGDAAARCVAQVTAVGAGVNGTVTVSTTIKYGTVPTSNSGSRALKAGGASASLGILAANAAFNTGTVPQSTRINVKAGTYANTTTSRTFGAGGSTTVVLWWRGYKTTIGDQDANGNAVAGTDIPLFTSTTGTFTIQGGHQKHSSVAYSGAPSAALVQITTTNSNYLYRFRAENTSSNAAASALSMTASNHALIACYFKSPATASQVVNITGGSNFALTGTVIVGGIIGLKLTTQSVDLNACIFDSQAGDAIQATTGIIAARWCSFYASQGNGIVWSGTPGGLCVVTSCYFEGINQASKAAINNNSGTNTELILPIANAYYNCTSNLSGITESFTIFDNGTLASAAFTNPGSQNFSVGTVAKAIGFPGTFENTSAYQGYMDVGAVQRQEPAGGGGPSGFSMLVPQAIARQSYF